MLELAEGRIAALLERAKFAAIFAQFIDEFFAVRVAGLLELEVGGRNPLPLAGWRRPLRSRRSGSASRAHRPAGQALEARASSGARGRGLEIATVDEASGELWLGKYFEREIYPILTPLAVRSGQPFPYVSGLSMSLGVIADRPRNGRGALRARRRCRRARPVRHGRQGQKARSARGDRALPPDALRGWRSRSERSSASRATPTSRSRRRPDDLLEAVETELRQRRFGDVVRLELSSSASRAMRDRLMAGLGVRPSQVAKVEGLDQVDLWQLVALDRADLKHASWTPVVPPRWARVKTATAGLRGDPPGRPDRPPPTTRSAQASRCSPRRLERPGSDRDQDRPSTERATSRSSSRP